MGKFVAEYEVIENDDINYAVLFENSKLVTNLSHSFTMGYKNLVVFNDFGRSVTVKERAKC
jgi:hypothetical protein